MVLALLNISSLSFPVGVVHSSPDSKVIYCQTLDLIAMVRGGFVPPGALLRLQQIPSENRTFDYPDRVEGYTKLLALLGLFTGTSLLNFLLLQALVYVSGGFFLYRILLSWEFPGWLAAALTALFFLMPVSFSWRFNLSKETLRIPALLGFFWVWGLALKGGGSFGRSLAVAGFAWVFLLTMIFIRPSEASLLLALAGLITFLLLLCAGSRPLLVSRGLCFIAMLGVGAMALFASASPPSRAEKVLAQGFAEIWKPSNDWTRIVDRPISKVCFSRYRFFRESTGAGLTVGPQSTAPSTGWFLNHVPAFFIQGLCPKLPGPWLQGQTTDLPISQRLLVAGETWFSFGAMLLAPALLISRRNSGDFRIWGLALVCVVSIFFFSSAVPNSAALLRMRFPYAYLLISMGLGWMALKLRVLVNPGSNTFFHKLR